MKTLKDFPVTHARIRPVQHPQLGVMVNGYSAVRYLRFMRPVHVNRLELPRDVYGRWVPKVPTHPAHITVSILDRQTNRWQIIKDVEIPPDPRTSGQGLTSTTPAEEMDAHFARILQDPPLAIELGDVLTDHLRVECDREHPVWPNHGECNGGEFNVPFGILNPLRAIGDPGEGELEHLPYNPGLKQGTTRPEAPKGMTVRDRPEMLLFEGRRLSVGVSLRRPMIMHLGWDFLGEGEASRNLIMASRSSYGICSMTGGLSGPLLRTLNGDFGSNNWTGEVSVRGNRVSYTNLKCVDGLTVDAHLTIEENRLVVELTQTCAVSMPVIETEAWRLAWDARAGVTGLAAVPTLLPGRNGDVRLPAMWANDRTGCLSCRILDGEGEGTRFQLDSYRTHYTATGGVVLCPRLSGEDACMTLPSGKRHASFELAVTSFSPASVQPECEVRTGVRRHWGTVFACFRPELGGFSNNALSTNCHLAQALTIEVVKHTAVPKVGPDPIALGKFTIERGLLDGGGYGYWRNLYMDSDPNLVCAAGCLHQARPDVKWLKRIQPGLTATIERIESTIGSEGLAICKDLTGNSGSYRWSSNCADVVGFGHLDAYVNAWDYRAFRNAAALLAELGERGLAERCRERAAGIRRAYADCFLNPKTGWVAGWRSLDGQLHDYAFIWLNGTVLAFGLIEPAQARKALAGLERLRDEVGAGSARMGTPHNLLPIPWDEQMLPKRRGEILPSFETYIDGGMCPGAAIFYLRALSIYGLKDRAQRMAAELEEGYAVGLFNGGIGKGNEFRSWEGMPTGYEGTLVGCFGVLYAMAVEQGVITPTEPEWWPAGG